MNEVTNRNEAVRSIRPWGSYTVLEERTGYKLKRIEVAPGKRLSLQMHNHRSEHWIIVSGTALVTKGEEEMHLRSNESIYIPSCTKHRLANLGVIPLIMIEVQTGEYCGENDILRYEDDFARAIN